MLRQQIEVLLGPHLRFSPVVSETDNLPAFCPFHKGGHEQTPSMYIFVGKAHGNRQPGMAFCHTCNEGWSLKSLLRKLKVSLKQIDSLKEFFDEIAPRKPKNLYDEISFDMPQLPEAVLGAFQYLPVQLLNAGFQKEILAEYDIGFDRQRKRIIFPLRDHLGNLVGLSGRTVRGAYPRYKVYRSELEEVSPGYKLNKGRMLWGLDKFYTSCMMGKVDKPVVLCEGFKATLWAIQSGYPHTAALLGAHCTKEQSILLSRVANEVTLFLDNDQAGRRATYKIARSLMNSVSITVATYPKGYLGKSPDDLNEAQILQAIKTSKPFSLWRQQ